MLRISYRDDDRAARLSWEQCDEAARWLGPIRRIFFDHTNEVTLEGPHEISLPWWAFLSARREFHQLIQGFRLVRGKDYDVDADAAKLLKTSLDRQASFDSAKKSSLVSEELIQSKLDSVGFTRQLNDNQKSNVGVMAGLPAAATFSVPGAGKTTEALATFFFRADAEDHLLVVAPKNAFGSWDEQLLDCIPNIADQFVRLRGGWDKISALLEQSPKFMLITYQQLPRVRELIAEFVASHPTHVYLDESHRIKGGATKPTTQAVLSISHLPVGKLIMSGTPMPQSEDDLVSQFSFLFPEVPVFKENAVNLIAPIYVRTNKEQLGLRPPDRIAVPLPMNPVQAKLYDLMKYQVARDAEHALSARSKSAFRSLGRPVARLLQFVSNPAILSREIGFAHEDYLAAVLEEGDSPKLRYVVSKARELAKQDKKVLIWSSFVANVEILAHRLADLGAVYIHGGVDAGDEEDDDTREGKIRLFRNDPNVKVLVANPAAASEGISLHTVCHHAIYLDRTFNAAHYLQSEDRIHRLGLAKDQETTIEIIECIGTVDEAVRYRLGYKIAKMADALNDSSLHVDPVFYDPPVSDDPVENVVGTLDAEDVQAVIESITGT